MNALAQTGWTNLLLTENNWREIVREKIESISWEQAREDVRPFLASQLEIDLLTKENLIRLLKQK